MFQTPCLLCKAPKLTFTDSYIVLIADTSDLDNFSLVFFCQLESLGARQPLFAIRPASAISGFKNGID
jgi:hypothetical protein